METKAKHTPGPWYDAKVSGGQGLIIAEATGANVAVAYDKCDAPLIAAAPELLEAAKSALVHLDDGHHVEEYENLKAAILKAEGGK